MIPAKWDNGFFVPSTHEGFVMPHEPMHHELLTALESELLACFRAMDEQAKAATVYIMAAHSMGRRDFVESARLSVVSND